MFNWFQQSFQEYSIIWLLVSSIIGGIIGASIKFVFDVVLPEQLQQRREAIRIKQKYTTPLLLAASELRGRLENMIRYIEAVEKEKWLSKPAGGYYYISTLYVVGQFFGWLQILRNTVVYLDLTTTTETKRFEYFLNIIEKGFSNPSLFQRISDTGHPLETTDRWIYSFWLQAIGEMMIMEGNDDPRIIDYATFHQKFSQAENSEFKQWFDALGEIFWDLKSSEKRFQRIVAIHAILTAFIDYVDPKHLRTQKRPYYWELLREEEVDTIKQQIVEITRR